MDDISTTGRGGTSDLRERINQLLDRVDHEGNGAAEELDRGLRVILDDAPANDRLAVQARDISILLSDAGTGPCSLTEGVRTIIEQRDKWLDAFNRSEQFQNGPTKARDLLRSALVSLVGVDGREDLEQMEVIMRAIPAPAADKAATIDAIHALIATLPVTVERA